MNEMTATTQEPASPALDSRRFGAQARVSSPQPGGAVYGLGMIGALVYFIGLAETRQDYALAVGKALVWPALLVYLAFKKLGD